MDIQTLLDPAIAVAVAVVGWWVKGIRADFKELSKSLTEIRSELHNEMQNYTHKETCRAHREDIYAQLNAGLMRAVNDTARMQTLYDNMTPDERRAHAAQCLFKHDMEGIG